MGHRIKGLVDQLLEEIFSERQQLHLDKLLHLWSLVDWKQILEWHFNPFETNSQEIKLGGRGVGKQLKFSLHGFEQNRNAVKMFFNEEPVCLYSLFFDPWHQSFPFSIMRSVFNRRIHIFLLSCSTDFTCLEESIHDRLKNSQLLFKNGNISSDCLWT